MKAGDRALLLDKDGKSYLVKLQEREFHTDKGVIKLGEVIGKKPGDKIETHIGKRFTVLKPSMADHFRKIKRVPQIMLPKDAAQIIAHTGIGPRGRVVDAGTGSGALAIFLGNIVRPDGKVYSYEVKDDFIRVAKENIEKVGLQDIIEVKKQDIYEGIDETELDLVALDIPSPEKVIPHAENSLKPGGYLTTFTPCIEHLQRIYKKLPEHKFQNYETIECLVRNIQVNENCTRPSTRMIAHTGYLTFARRV